jgi:hypothetical protein
VDAGRRRAGVTPFLPVFGNQSPLHEDLLGSAHQVIQEQRPERYGVAVVLAHTALEVFTEQVRTQLIEKRQLSAELGEWIVKRTREVARRIDFYVALTNDQIKDDKPVWDPYATTHLNRRNEVVHKGRQVSKEDAEHSYRVVEGMINRMKQGLERMA